MLYKCYRNPLDVLVTAHALGFGIYSERPVQMLQNKEHWADIGYTIEDNQDLRIGTTVTIKRNHENSPLSIYKYQAVQDIIQCYKAESFEDECIWISENIKAAVSEGIKPHDILVVCLDDRHAKHYFAKISLLLTRNAIRSNNLLASSSSAPPFSLDDMVTLSTVHRAKGNEAAMVFAAGIDGIFKDKATRKGRNRLFTAFTRTKAWLRVSGLGEKAQLFFNEIDQSIKNSPSLVFKVPDASEIETIQRDLNSRPQEFEKMSEMYNTLLKKGFTKEEIHAELDSSDGDLLSE